MPNAEKAYIWIAADFSEGEAKVEKFAARLRTAEDATEFSSKFNAARLFNQKAKDNAEDLVWADTVEDVDEVVDDIDVNTTAAGGDGEGDEQ